MLDISGLIGDIIGWVMLLIFFGSIFIGIRFVYTLFSSTKKWNAETDQHITTAGGSGGTIGGAYTTTHNVPKDEQAQAKMYIPKDKS
jgi:hypothetical protein